MKLYIADNEKLVKTILPNKVDEIFLINYKCIGSKVDTIINIESDGEQWKLRSDGIINVVLENTVSQELKLEDYRDFQLQIHSKEVVTVYTLPTVDIMGSFSTVNMQNIIIGNVQNSNIYYQANMQKPFQYSIIPQADGWYAVCNDENINLYVNEARVRYQRLRIGDILFTNGLIVVWMGSFIKVNNPNNFVSVQGMQQQVDSDSTPNNIYSPVNEEDASRELYEDDEYFSHTPRLRTIIEDEEVSIDSPPQNEKNEELPMLLQMGASVTMLAGAFVSGYSLYNGIIDGKPVKQLIPQIVMVGSMLFGSIIMPRLIASYRKSTKKRKEKLRQKKYSAYLKTKEEKMSIIMKQQIQILNENNPTLEQWKDIIIKRNSSLWNREIRDDDFLTVRVGNGNLPAKIIIRAPEEHFTMDEDNLMNMVFEVCNKSRTLDNVPITYSFTEKPLSAFVCEPKIEKDYLNGIMLQLMAAHSANDLKIVILTNESNKKKWDYAKMLTHCWSPDKETRLYATNLEEAKEVCSYLEQQAKERKEMMKETSADKDKDDAVKTEDETEYKNFLPYYLIISDDYNTVKNIPFIQKLLKREKGNIGFSLLFCENTMKNLPYQCGGFILVQEAGSAVISKELSKNSQIQFAMQINPTIDMYDMSCKLANIPILATEGAGELPTMLTFLEMNSVSRIEQLNVLNRWQTNNPVVSLSTPIGVHSSGDLFKLDLHEKFHGPHGLIAGSTGSGKSEFIISYILSMATNYHPYEVQFVLIDYKGGGLAGAFENREQGTRIPHLTGTITNLDTSEMNRTLVSIESELKRRQRMFNEARDRLGESTIDIYKYQKYYREGALTEPISHLFIISDEFAELKSQQPDFMAQLISTARIGRSLGVHLILATQKPSGVVNDQIWSNSKFKICLKVQDRSDSQEMLKRPEAASIKETGRFYLQVGYDEYFDIGQSAWGGAKYVPTDRVIRKVDDAVVFVNNTGYSIKTINDIAKNDAEEVEEKGDQLTNTVKYLTEIAKRENLVTKKLWLDAIPEEIFINNIRTKYAHKPVPYVINPVVGEYDNPSGQEQGLLTLDLTNVGHTLIYGMPGSGKENFISTLVYSSCVEHSPDEVNFYIIDMGAETLKSFYKFPHVGEVMTGSEGDKILNMFIMLDDELDRRKNMFVDYSGSYIEYCKISGSKLPLIVVVINNYEVFTEVFGKISDMIQPMIRDSAKYGVIFVFSTAVTNGVRGRTAASFLNKLSMQLSDNTEYRSILNSPRGLYPGKVFGRGIVALDENCYEFQTTYIAEKSNISTVIRMTADKLNQAYKSRAKKVPVVPEVVTPDLLSHLPIELAKMPVGYNVSTKEPYCYDMSGVKVLPILANSINDHMTFLDAMIKQFKQVEGANLKVIDVLGICKKTIEGINYYKDDFDRVIKEVVDLVKSGLTKNLFIIIGAGELKDKMSAETSAVYEEMLNDIKTLGETNLVFVDNYNSFKNLQVESWYRNCIDSTSGIWLGEGIAMQVALTFNNLTMDERKVEFPYMGFATLNGKHVLMKYVADVELEVGNEK